MPPGIVRERWTRAGSPSAAGTRTGKPTARRAASSVVRARARSGSAGAGSGARSTRTMLSPLVSPSSSSTALRAGGTAATATTSARAATATAARSAPHGRARRSRRRVAGHRARCPRRPLALAAPSSSRGGEVGRRRPSTAPAAADELVRARRSRAHRSTSARRPLEARAREPRLDGSRPAAEHGCDLALGQLEQVAQREHRAVALAEPRERREQLVAALAVEQRGLRRRSRVPGDRLLAAARRSTPRAGPRRGARRAPRWRRSPAATA